MCMVAVGHWLAAEVHLDSAGNLAGGNGLAAMPLLHPLTWVFQVMPLFFCVGGFANAASLISASRKGTSDRTWIALRLRRLLGPVSMFAGSWLLLLVTGSMVGQFALMKDASSLAAIPIWFLAAYTADIALSPMLLRAWDRWQGKALATLVGVVVALDLARVVFGVSLIQLPNVIIGWSCFQLMGIAWYRGWMAHAARRRMIGGFSAITAVALVAFGPWPVSMVSVPHAAIQNTWPPSAPLIAFGLAQCIVAVSLAPSLERLLDRHPKVWKGVVLGASCSMSVYLWHLTAFAISAGVLALTGNLSAALPGTTGAMLAKVPMIGLAVVALVGIVGLVARRERATLVDKRTITIGPWALGSAIVLLIASFDFLTLDGVGSVRGAMSAVAIVLVRHVLNRSSTRSEPLNQPERSVV